jgi:hypothetical protein
MRKGGGGGGGAILQSVWRQRGLWAHIGLRILYLMHDNAYSGNEREREREREEGKDEGRGGLMDESMDESMGESVGSSACLPIVSYGAYWTFGESVEEGAVWGERG